MRRHWRTAVVSLVSLGALVGAGPGVQAQERREGPAFPAAFPLPDGFQPEGIAIGRAPVAYFGSRVDGDIYRVDLRTGKGAVFSQGPGTPSLGMKVDRRGRLFVAGGSGGDARVVDTRTGRVLASYRLAEGASFVNDVVLHRDAAWFTDSTNKVLYKLPLGRDGALPAAARRLEITGVEYGEGINANGIVPTPDGRNLLVVQSNQGRLLRVDPRTGRAGVVDLGGESLQFGDGLLLKGRTLYAVQNRLNVVAEVRLNDAGTAGTVVRRIGDPRFDVPTTAAAFKGRLYLPNARFTTPPTPTTSYNAVAIIVR
ncbi:SMP-30/gluconolactonase/LRE family protein [Thermomonospora cellulosilytica]|uniref:Sugar lactone lactonase YvrE n=1 Tax=Thermomonospora cellulosilytica TaxID=1411118 RepID=A0A7W3RAB1_9ACTN|nr:SMP-30/gluconolactonase/LRE family protein [Thermomonospora cellulosilytica]MBA9006208.1 sugar lactone lactonase YvrE [Thermomonospora cellulosilytica]